MKVLVLLLIMAVTGLAVGAQTPATPAEIKPKFTDVQQKVLLLYSLAKVALGICGMNPNAAECKKEDFNKDYGEAISRIAADPALAMHILSEAVMTYEGMKGNAKSAAQVSQIADQQNVELIRLMVAQNQRIIDLLEQLVKKRP